MKILVTGIAGFIAARTASLLLEQGHEVVGVDNLNAYYDVRLKTYRLRELARAAGAEQALLDRFDLAGANADRYGGPTEFCAGALTFTKLDIEDRSRIDALFDAHRFDAVLNLAARAGVRYSMIDPEVYMTTNALGTLHLMDAMQRQECRKLVLASTSSLYAGQPMPFSEDLPVNTPISPYAASKKAAEALAYSYHYLYGMDVSVVRYFTVFGPAGRPDMSIFRFIKWIDEGKPVELFGDGSQSRDFTFVDDIAYGTIAAMTPLGYEIINLGGGNNPISINQVLASLESALGKKARIDRKPFHRADMTATYADISKANRMLHWQPQISPQEGFLRTVEWYHANRPWLRNVAV